MALVWIPSNMRHLTGGQSRIRVEGSTLADIISSLEVSYPGIRDVLVRDDLIKDEIAVAIDGEQGHQGLFQEVDDSSEVHFIPMVAGG
jgi:molybdopterin converting factor small subunit